MTKDTRHMLFSVVIALAYTALNASFVLFTYLPGLIVLIFWGALAPLAATVFSWIYLRRHAANTQLWTIMSSILTVFYVLAGVATIYYVGNLWASV